MTKIYVVTEGEYSDKEITGVFDDPELAKRFQVYHAHNERIEEYGLNPTVPEFHGLRYGARYEWNTRRPFVWRESNATADWHPTGLTFYTSCFGARELNCQIIADSEEHAMKAFREKISAFLAGSTHAFDDKGAAYQMIGGEIVKVT